VSGIAHRQLASVSLFLLACSLMCGRARAQAWVSDRGEGSVSLTYQNYDVAGHFDPKGHKNTNGGTQSHALVTELDYGVTDTFGLLVSLPFIASKYTGPPSYVVGGHLVLPGPLDDRSYHAAFQDLRIEVRRLVWGGPVAFAPFVGVLLPSHNYETEGEAVPGRHRRDLQFGTSVGVDLGRILPGSYVSGRYAYGTAQRLLDFPFTRSNIDVEGGYAVLPRVVIRGLMNQQIRHHGPSVDELVVDWEDHDRFIAPSYVNLGGGASVAVTRSSDVYGLWVSTVSGSNGAHRARTLAFGVTFSLRSHLQGLGGPDASAPQVRPGSRRLIERFPLGLKAAAPGM
jgi:hypothetical protein